MNIIYFISDVCVGCGGCRSVCPAGCISGVSHPLVIDTGKCVRCGRCFSACPLRAIKKLSVKAERNEAE